jgi:hypothetical protein
MKRMVVLLGFVLLVAAAVSADQWDKKTILTVKEPVQAPGITLYPGKYVIKLVESLSDRHIVRIMNERENEVLATILAIPNYRLTPTDNSQFLFWETPAGNPRALRAWFYPGDNFGQEFAYPKDLSAKIAEYTQTPAPSTTAVTEAELKTAPVVEIDKSGEEKPLEARVHTAPAPETAPVFEAAPAREQADRPAELPATGSPVPALALASLLTLATGFALRFASKPR